MTTDPEAAETFEEQRVTYTLQKDDRFYVVENVPARVSTLTGEQLFAPQTVARLQKIINGQIEPPARLLETPVFKFGM